MIFFFPFYHTGGAERVHLDVVKAVGKGNGIVIFTERSYNDHFLKDFEASAHCFHFYRFLNNLYYKKALSVMVRMIGRVRIVKTFSCNSFYYYKALPLFGKKAINLDLLHAFTFPEEGAEKISLPYVKYLSQRIVINKKTRDDYRDLYKENGIAENYLSRIIVIPNAVNVATTLNRDYHPEKLRIMYCGRIAQEKRVHLVVAIGKILKEDCYLDIYGPIDVPVKGLDGFYRGVVSHEEKMNHIYDRHDILMITSTREGFPMVMMEAMAYGVVCIATDVGGICEHITNGENGFLVPSFEEEDKIVDGFENIIKHLADDRDLLKRLSISGYQYAKNNFGRDRFNEAYRKLLL